MKSYRIITYLTAGLMTGHAPAGEKQIYIESVHKQTNFVKTFDNNYVKVLIKIKKNAL